MKWLSLLAALFLSSAVGCQSGHGDHEGHDHGSHEEHGESEDEHDDHDDHEEGDDHDDHDEHGGEEGEGEEEAVKLSPEAMARSGVKVAPVTMGSLKGSVEVAAEVQLNPDNVAHISPLVDGQLVDVGVKIGDKVEAGQELTTLRSVALGQARADLNRTMAFRKVTKQNLDRQKQLRAEGISSQRSLLEARFAFDEANAEQSAALSRLRVFGVKGGVGPGLSLSSPISGMVIERHATRGESVSPEKTLFVIGDLSRVWVIGRVYEKQISKVAPGMQATLSLAAYPSRTWTGTVDYVASVLDEETRTLPVRVEIDNPDGALKPGLFGTLRLAMAANSGSVVLVPETAVQTMENRPVVFIPGHEEGEFEMKVVTIGRASDGLIEIIEGLDRDSKVVVKGGFVLKSELMRGQLGHGHAH